MNRIFWLIVALDALMFLVLLIVGLRETGQRDGGREMSIAFFVVLPCVGIGLAVLLHVFCEALPWRLLALLMVAGPGLFVAGAQLRGVYLNHAIEQRRLGAGYFHTSALRAMGMAVVQRDTDAVRRIGPTVDVNAVGEDGMTLLALAAEEAASMRPAQGTGENNAVVRALLALGAHPSSALETATKLKDAEILRELLAAGADPNLRLANGQPLVFSRLNVMPLANLRLLAQHGLDLDCTSYGESLALTSAFKRRWDILEFLIEGGADTSRTREDGRGVESEVVSQIAGDASAGRATPPELLRVKALLDAARSGADRQ